VSQSLLVICIVALLISVKACRGGDYSKLSAGLLQATCYGIPGLIVPYPATSMCHLMLVRGQC
ncbi:hypothetical protein CI102_6672, partial [Trichoderma harzianum]